MFLELHTHIPASKIQIFEPIYLFLMWKGLIV